MNESLKYIRQNSDFKSTVEVEELSDIPEEEEPDFEEIPRDDIMSMIRLLPEGYRTVFNLYVFEKKSHKEIAGLLGIAENSSASQFHRAKAMLVQKIKEFKTSKKHNMNNEWLNSLRSRMEDHEEDVPDGLWDDIRDELFSDEEEKQALFGWISESQHEEGGKQKAGGADSIQRTLLYRMAGIAAAIVLLIVMMKILPGDKDPKVLAQTHTDVKNEKERNSVQKGLELPAGSDVEENINISSDHFLDQNILNSNISEKTSKQISSESVGNNGVKGNENRPETGKTE